MFRYTAKKARIWLVLLSSFSIFFYMTLILISPLLRIPFNYTLGENIRLIELALPVFTNYLFMSANFIFQKNKDNILSEDKEKLLFILVNVPFLLFIFMSITIFYIFYHSNLPTSEGLARPESMSFGQLYQWSSYLLAFFTSISSIVAGYLFAVDNS